MIQSRKSLAEIINNDTANTSRTIFSPFLIASFTATNVPAIIPSDSAIAANQFTLPVTIKAMTAQGGFLTNKF
jgi:hypothetical protein